MLPKEVNIKDRKSAWVRKIYLKKSMFNLDRYCVFYYVISNTTGYVGKKSEVLYIGGGLWAYTSTSKIYHKL